MEWPCCRAREHSVFVADQVLAYGEGKLTYRGNVIFPDQLVAAAAPTWRRYWAQTLFWATFLAAFWILLEASVNMYELGRLQFSPPAKQIALVDIAVQWETTQVNCTCAAAPLPSGSPNCSDPSAPTGHLCTPTGPASCPPEVPFPRCTLFTGEVAHLTQKRYSFFVVPEAPLSAWGAFQLCLRSASLNDSSVSGTVGRCARQFASLQAGGPELTCPADSGGASACVVSAAHALRRTVPEDGAIIPPGTFRFPTAVSGQPFFVSERDRSSLSTLPCSNSYCVFGRLGKPLSALGIVISIFAAVSFTSIEAFTHSVQRVRCCARTRFSLYGFPYLVFKEHCRSRRFAPAGRREDISVVSFSRQRSESSASSAAPEGRGRTTPPEDDRPPEEVEEGEEEARNDERAPLTVV